MNRSQPSQRCPRAELRFPRHIEASGVTRRHSWSIISVTGCRFVMLSEDSPWIKITRPERFRVVRTVQLGSALSLQIYQSALDATMMRSASFAGTIRYLENDWPIGARNATLSEKDRTLPLPRARLLDDLRWFCEPGFIGSALVRLLIAERPHSVLVIDKLTFAGNL
jgi:hypothetical protein